MQTVFEITKTHASSPSFLNRFWLWLLYLVELSYALLNFYTEFMKLLLHWLIMCNVYANLFQKKKLLLLPHFCDRFSFCLFYLIGLGGGFKTYHTIILKFINLFRKRYDKFIQTSQIKSQKMLLLITFLNRFWFSLLYLVELELGTRKLLPLNCLHRILRFCSINYASMLCKFIPKITKIASPSSSWPRFSVLFVYVW